MQVKSGDEVVMRDGRRVAVTDAADQDPEQYKTYREAFDGSLVLVAENPVETIFVGYEIVTNHVGSLAVRARGGTVVSDMSEVVSIVN